MKNKRENQSSLTTTFSCLLACVLIVTQMFLTVGYAASNKDDDFDKLISMADIIVLGKCTAVTTEWRKKKIYSTATIRVENVIKGEPSAVIQLEYMGGTAMHPKLNAPITMNVSNGVQLSEGDEAVLMLHQLPNNNFQVVGSTQGIIPVVMGEGIRMIQSGARKIESKSSSKDHSAVLYGRQMNIDEFIEYLRSRILTEKSRSDK